MQNFDIIIVGAGLVGRLCAICLAKNGLTVASIDHETTDAILNAASDGRTTAVTLGSKRLFDRYGLWDSIASHAQPIQQIRVFENNSPWTLDYDARDMGDEPMGFIVENTIIRQALYEFTPENLTVFAPSSVQSLQRTETNVNIQLSSGEMLSAPLLIAADGRHSKLRTYTSITTKTHEYDQSALVAHIIHEKPHNDTAFEIFQKEGPLAVLPLRPDQATGQYKSGLVWCKPRTFDWAQYDDQSLTAMFEKLFPYYGAITFLPKRWIYPLSYTKVSSMIDNRMALIGDAAHVVHPIAGQGVNLGWRDVATLIDELSKAKSQGIDLGCPFLLKRYDSQRKFDRLSVLWATDGISHLYHSQLPPLRFARNAAFAVLNQIKPFKRAVMRRAMGIF